MIADSFFAACLLAAANLYEVDYPLLHAIYAVEGGKDGAVSKNTNGTVDIGRMQINSLWLPVIAEQAGVPKAMAYQKLRDDACYNAKFAAWILKTEQVRTGDYWRGVGHYHSRTPRLRDGYIKRIVSKLHTLYGEHIFRKRKAVYGSSQSQRPAQS